MVENAPGTDLLTVPEAAAVLKVSPVTVSRWLRQGRLPAYRLGPRAVRIRRSDLAAVFSPARERQTANTENEIAPIATSAFNVSNLQPADHPVGTVLQAVDLEGRLAALATAAAVREQIFTRRKGLVLPALDSERKRGKRG